MLSSSVSDDVKLDSNSKGQRSTEVNQWIYTLNRLSIYHPVCMTAVSFVCVYPLGTYNGEECVCVCVYMRL